MKEALLLLTLAVPAPAGGDQFSTEPILRLETGAHTAAVSAVAADNGGRFLVTGSLDQTVRLWDIPSGKLLSIMRPPIGSRGEGVISTVAISPDGEVIAAGRRGLPPPEGGDIYFFARSTGRPLLRIKGLPDGIAALAFSPDGRHLAVSVRQGKGLWLFQVSDGKEVGKDFDCKAESFGLDFSLSGQLITSCYDGFLRLYGPDLRQLAKAQAPGGKEPMTVRFSPAEQKIAIGYAYSSRVDVVSATTLAALYSPNTAETGSLERVAWSVDGRSLYATGYLRDAQSGQGSIRLWPEAGQATARDFVIGVDNRVLGLAPIPGGRVAFVVGSSWGMLNPDGRTSLYETHIADFRDASFDFRITSTAATVQFGYLHHLQHPARFSVEDRVLLPGLGPGDHLRPPLTEARGVSMTGWKNDRAPALNGKPLALWPYETSRALAIAPDGQSFLLGTDWFLRSFDSMGQERWRSFIPGTAWAVNLSADGRVAVAAFADGTIRWYRAENGQELLAFFPHADRKRWVVWTPSGYFDASIGGEELIGWHVNRGPVEAADFFPVSRFRDRFYRPDVVARILTARDEAAALAEADAEAQRRTPKTDLARLLPPVVTLLSPRDEVEAKETSVAFRVAVRSPSGEPVTAVRAYVDGRPAADTRGLVFEPDPVPVDPAAERTYTFSVPVPKRDCTVAIAAETRLATSEPVPVKVRWAAPTPMAEKPTLYLFAVGVSAYVNPALKLDLPAKDARDVVAAWKKQEGGLYGKVEARVLTDQEATKDAILSGLEWLETRTTQKDVAVLFFAGHGINDPRTGEYLFLPHDADLTARRVTLLPHREVLSALSALPGKVLVFLDTCHSGNLLGIKTRDVSDLTRLLNEMASTESGVVVFSATTGRGLAQETKGWENGAFTKALLEAMGGKADQDGDRSIWIAEIETYLGRRVRELTGGLQTPATAKPAGLPDFPVAVMGQR